VSSNGDQERASGFIWPLSFAAVLNEKGPSTGAFVIAALVDRAAVMHNVRVTAEEALRIRVGLAPVECSGQSTYDNRNAYNY
jgi:hypothetical protein